MQTRTFEENRNADIVYSEYRCFSDENMEKLFSYCDRHIISGNPIDDFVFNWGKELILPPHAFLYKRSCFERWGLFDENLRNGEDWDLYVRLSVHKPVFIFSDGIHALYRKHGEGICSPMNAATLHGYKIRMMRKHLNNTALSPGHREHIRFLLHNFVGWEGFDDLHSRRLLRGLKRIILASYFSGKPLYYFYHGLYWLKKGYLSNELKENPDV